jgi:hypothetical protein
MIDWFNKRKFEQNVVDTVQRRLIEVHGDEVGNECAGFFATGILQAQEFGELPLDLADRYRRDGFSVDEAALAMFDVSITMIKKFAPNARKDAEVSRILAAMEDAVDHIFLAKPGRIVPLNGTAGPAMEPWTKPYQP